MAIVSKTEATNKKGELKKGYVMKETKNGRVLYLSNKAAPRKKKVEEEKEKEKKDEKPDMTISMN